MTTVASIRVALEASTSSFRSAMQKATTSVTRFAARATAGAAAVAGAFSTAFGAAVRDADKLNNLAVRLGTTTEALSELRFVASQSGIDFNVFSTAMQRMVRRIDEAAKTGKGEAAPALERLGLDAERLNKLTVDRKFEVISERMSRMRDQSERVRLAMKLFDTEGVALVQTMTRGAKGIKEAREEARQLGIVLSQDDAKAAAKVSAEFDKLTSIVVGAGRQFLLRFAPDVGAALESVNKAVKANVSGFVDFAESFVRESKAAFSIVGIAAQKAASGDVSGAFETMTRLADALGKKYDWLKMKIQNALSPEVGSAFKAVIENFERGFRVIRAVLAGVGNFFGGFAAQSEQILTGSVAGVSSISRSLLSDSKAAFDSVLLGDGEGADAKLDELIQATREQTDTIRKTSGGSFTNVLVAQ